MNPNFSVTLSAQVVPTSTISKGQLMVSNGSVYVPATAANRALYGRTEAVALDDYGGVAATGFIRVQQAGMADQEVSILPPSGSGSYVRASAAGYMERFTPSFAGTSDLIGYAEPNGRVHLFFGTQTESTVTGGGGGGSPGGSNGDFQRNVGGAFGGIAGNAVGGPFVVPATIVDGDLYYGSGGALAKLAKGTSGQVLTQGATFPSWQNATGGGGFDPTTMSLTSYYRAPFTGVPWASSATPGTSSSSIITSAGGAIPTAGTAVNGYAPVSFNGTSQYLSEPNKTGAMYYSASTYSYAVLVNVSAAAATAGATYLDKQIICLSNDILGLCVTTDGAAGSPGVRAWHYNGVDYNGTPFTPMSLNAWHLVFVKYVGGTISCQVDSVAAVTASRGAVSTLSGGGFVMGASRTTSVFTAEQVLECWTSGADQSANFANYKTYCNTRYGLSL